MAGNAFKSNTITTAQVATTAGAKKILSENRNRVFAEIVNMDASISIYLGFNSSVLTTTGHLLVAGRAMGFEDYVGEVWAIPASGTPSVSTIEW